jgi:hypothetical protein
MMLLGGAMLKGRSKSRHTKASLSQREERKPWETVCKVCIVSPSSEPDIREESKIDRFQDFNSVPRTTLINPQPTLSLARH